MTAASHWEWRTFDEGFEETEARLRQQAETVQTTREIAVICDMSAGEAKIRDEMLEVLLPQRTMQGVELWKTVLKAPFPVDALTVARTFGYLEIRPPATDRDSYTVEQFLQEIVAPHHALTAVDIGRVRHAFLVNDCTADFSELTINGVPARTLGVEGQDATRVLQAVQSLALGQRPSMSFVAAIKHRLAAT